MLELISIIRSDVIIVVNQKFWIFEIWLEFVMQNLIKIAHCTKIPASNNQYNDQKNSIQVPLIYVLQFCLINFICFSSNSYMVLKQY